MNTMGKTKIILLFLGLFLVKGSLFAQYPKCIGFEYTIEPGTYGIATGYMPGNKLFTFKNGIVKLQNFRYSDGTEGFLNAVVSEEPIFNGDASELLNQHYIFPSNINLQFKFNQVSRGTVKQVCLNFVDGGGEENLSVNGDSIFIVRSFVELDGQEVAPGVVAHVELLDSIDFPAGTLCLTGTIDSFLIGGQELALDDICYQINYRDNHEDEDDDTCDITDLCAEVLNCNPNGTFNLHLDFVHDFVQSDSFFVFYRDELLGRFAVSELPLKLEGISGGHYPDYEPIKVCFPLPESENECCVETKIMVPDCGEVVEDTCTIEELMVEVLDCNEDGSFNVRLDFSHQLESSDSFYVQMGAGDTIGRFAISQLPLTLDSLSFRNDSHPHHYFESIYVCLPNTDCCAEKSFRLPDCEDYEEDCELGEIRYSHLECISDNRYRVTIQFESEHTSRKFILSTAGGFVDEFEYEDLPIRLSLPRTADSVDVWTIQDARDSTCRTTLQVTLPCATEEEEEDTCTLSNARYSNLECISENRYRVTINFDHNYTGRQFVLQSLSGYRDTFNYELLPLRLPIPRANDSLDVLSICDLDSPNCCTRLALNLPCQDDNGRSDSCHIQSLTAEPLHCEDGKFMLKVSFRAANTGIAGYLVFVDGQIFGPFRYSQTSVELGPFTADGETIYDVLVLDIANPTCFAYTEVQPVNCGGEEVWPGDANKNNRADHFDLLNIGLAYGATGSSRSVPGIAWQQKRALPWNKYFANSTDYAHADCNGDGIIDISDRVAIDQNYNLSHGPVEPVTQLPGTSLDPPIFVDLPDAPGLPAGLAFSVPVILGTADNYVENIYGLAFTIEFNPTVIDPASLQVNYPKSWFGTEDLDFITFHRIDPAGKIHIAITQIDQTNVSGFGTIAMISGVIDDIAGIAPSSEVTVTGIYAIASDESVVPLHSPTKNLHINLDVSTAVDEVELRKSLHLTPNPTTDWVQVFTPYQLPVKAIEVLDASGKSVQQPVVNTNRVSLNNLPKGIYILRIQIGEYILNERIVKM